MNKVRIENDELIVEPVGLDKVWALKLRVQVPLTHVRGATFDPGANYEPKGIRAPGLALPGKWAGTFILDGDKSFWNVSEPGKTVVIRLEEEHFVQLVLTVENSREIVDEINGSIQ